MKVVAVTGATVALAAAATITTTTTSDTVYMYLQTVSSATVNLVKRDT